MRVGVTLRYHHECQQNTKTRRIRSTTLNLVLFTLNKIFFFQLPKQPGSSRGFALCKSYSESLTSSWHHIMFKNLFGKKDGKGGGARMPTGGSQLKMTTQRRLARGVDCNSKTASVHIYFIIIFLIYGEPKKRKHNRKRQPTCVSRHPSHACCIVNTPCSNMTYSNYTLSEGGIIIMIV